jgi:hypothetical protein
MTWWLKRIYWTDEREDADLWWNTGVITDPPGRKSKSLRGGEQPTVGQVRPPYAPSYAVDDYLVVCFASSRGCPLDLVQRCPAILQVTGEPHWDPDLVDEGGFRPKEGDRWGVVTDVSCIHAVDPRGAPRIRRIGLKRLNQAPQSRLSGTLGEEARRLLEQIEQRSTNASKLSRVKVIPVEGGTIEGYDVETKDEVRRARRQEKLLVARYVKYMENQGDTIVRHKIEVRDTRGSLFSDIFNETRRQLVEAKVQTTRSNVRMAIGQLADYTRFIQPPPRRAVLLDTRPPSDLNDLLHRQEIAAIWPDGQRFTDDAGGEFT